MKKIFKLVLLCAFAFASSAALASRIEPFRNPPETLIATASGKQLNKEQIKQTIMRAATAANWTATSSADGQVAATLIVRGKHTLNVEIPYTAEHYTVRYKDSVNLNYGTNEEGVTVIHPNANRWMEQLKEAIRVEFSRQ